MVNAAGGLVASGVMAWLAQSRNEGWRLLLVVGLLGGLTTFSSFTHGLWYSASVIEWVVAALPARCLAHAFRFAFRTG